MKFSVLCCWIIVVLLFDFNSYPQIQERVIQKDNVLYLSNTLIVKIKSESVTKMSGNMVFSDKLQQKLNELGVVNSNSMFGQNGKELNNELNRIFCVKYSTSEDPKVLASKIRMLGEVEWAEPKYVYEVEYIPSDPFYSSQYALQKIKAAEAWNISTGDTSIVIGIVDTGVDWDHPDLTANIWRNWNEIPNNGIDDDNNGFIDDVRGWDFGGLNGTPDNNPMEDRPDHGTHVAGDASAVTDNSIGVAAIGFKCKIMAVKTSRDDYRNQSGSPYIVYGFEGIKYAVDNGAKIINCSWGGGGFSFLGQEVINYATSLGALVVAAAGNNNSSSPFYPASYNNVLSVAATDEGDIKTSFSNYGANVDVSAPGINVYSSWQNDTYRYGTGTSFSSPITAGLAALVKSVFPAYNPNQIAEQIRTNCDDINSINPGFVNHLGRGRINAFKSLSNTNSKSARAIEVKFSDEQPGGNGDGVIQAGETIQVRCKFMNFLSPTSNLGIYLESSNNYSSVQNYIFNAGARATLDTFTNNSSAYSFQVNQNVPQNTLLTFNLNYVDGSYQDFQVISVIANPTYATQAGDNIALTITSKGTLAYNDYPNNSQGNGFTYLDGSNLLYEGALMLATSSAKISDCARGSSPSIQNSDFSTVIPFTITSPGAIADIEGTCLLNDNGAGASKIGLDIKLSSYSFNDAENENYILLKYDLKNTTTSVINNLFAGLFFDWDFADATEDFTAYDSLGKLGYVYRVGGNPNTWVGTALVSSTNYGFWAINNNGGDGGFSIYDGFTDSEKWQSLSNGIGKPQAGTGDISHVISSGPFSIQPNEVVSAAFAIAAGLNLNDLRIAVGAARNKYTQIITSIVDDKSDPPQKFYLSQNYPNPFNPTTKISWQLPVSSHQKITIYDVLGNEVAVLVDEWKEAGTYEVEFNAMNLPSGIYFCKLRTGEFTLVNKMVLVR